MDMEEDGWKMWDVTNRSIVITMVGIVLTILYFFLFWTTSNGLSIIPDVLTYKTCVNSPPGFSPGCMDNVTVYPGGKATFNCQVSCLILHQNASFSIKTRHLASKCIKTHQLVPEFWILKAYDLIVSFGQCHNVTVYPGGKATFNCQVSCLILVNFKFWHGSPPYWPKDLGKIDLTCIFTYF